MNVFFIILKLLFLLILTTLPYRSFAFDQGQRDFEFFKQDFDYTSEKIYLSDFEKYDPLFYLPSYLGKRLLGKKPSIYRSGDDKSYLDSYHNMNCKSEVSTGRFVQFPLALFTLDEQKMILDKFKIHESMYDLDSHAFVLPFLNVRRKTAIERLDYIKKKKPYLFTQTDTQIDHTLKYFRSSEFEGVVKLSFKKLNGKIVFRIFQIAKRSGEQVNEAYGFCEFVPKYYCSLSSNKKIPVIDEYEDGKYRVYQNSYKKAYNLVMIAKTKKMAREGLIPILGKDICKGWNWNSSDPYYRPYQKKLCIKTVNQFLDGLNSRQLQCGPKLQDLGVSRLYMESENHAYWAQRGEVIQERYVNYEEGYKYDIIPFDPENYW